jgi:WD40 repeat protein
VASSDKGGQVALWAVDYSPDGDAGSSSGAPDGGEGEDFVGVVKFSPHSEYVSALAWLGRGRGAKLLSSSYDGSVRLLDVEKGVPPGGGSGGGCCFKACLL